MSLEKNSSTTTSKECIDYWDFVLVWLIRIMWLLAMIFSATLFGMTYHWMFAILCVLFIFLIVMEATS